MYMHAYLLNMKTDTFIIHTVIPKLNMVIIILRKQIFEYNPSKFHLIDRASANVSLIDRNMQFFYQNPATNRMQILKYLKICKM